VSLGGGWYSELITALLSGLTGAALILLSRLRLVLLVLLPYVLKWPLVVLSFISAASNKGDGEGLWFLIVLLLLFVCLLLLFLALFVLIELLTVSDRIMPFLISVLAEALTVWLTWLWIMSVLMLFVLFVLAARCLFSEPGGEPPGTVLLFIVLVLLFVVLLGLLLGECRLGLSVMVVVVVVGVGDPTAV
jgi:hypothetical protein